MKFFISVLAGALTGVLSAFGIGGGTLLMIYMTSFGGIPQIIAQGINLSYFLPTSAAALVSHAKRGYIRRDAVIPAVVSGSVFTLVSAFAATAMDVSVMKKLFGLFLIYVGISEIFKKPDKKR